jgi:hypothetical protein
MLKNIILYTMIATFAVGTVSTVYAESEMVTEVNENKELKLLALLATKGEIKEFKDNRIHIIGTAVNENSLTEAILNVEQAQIFDMVTGQLVKIDSIKVGEEVLVYYSPRMTMSLPAQGNAVQIFINVNDENASVLKMILAKKTGESEGSVHFLDENGSVIIGFNEDTEILDREGNIVSIEALNVEDELLVWFNFMAMSFPGQATATKAVVIHQGKRETEELEKIIAIQPIREIKEEVVIDISKSDSIPVKPIREIKEEVVIHQGKLEKIIEIEEEEVNTEIEELKMIKLSELQSPYTNEEGVVMVPLRVIAEANGVTVDFNKDNKMITISKGDITISYRNGDEVYSYNDEVKKFESINYTELKNEISFIALDFLVNIL